MSGTEERELVTKWRDLMTCYNKVTCDLDRELQDQHGLGLSEFEALDRLIESGQDKLRMHELAEGMYLSQSAFSRAVARLERAGLVGRSLCMDDRRAMFVTATEKGRARHAEARDSHRKVLAHHLD
ncbi:MarR family winged helix-turn-helix transcriptional regulator [Jiangella alkaliphila]|uniref:DNA-binding transcriptional regulator, MarR family n=1 Tax=Jiangella alkaliphila TaxID=419479 RepID=A0A1H2H625_9ACTN|nr:MarR family transcriptional regulator [Jiangella alkaliphila]SDU27320.1 DNA-binding transcriptional regulator, MarR family [Jiangella alkaliphila]